MAGIKKKNVLVLPSTWKDLNSLKNPGESFDSVINRLIAYWWKNQDEGEL